MCIDKVLAVRTQPKPDQTRPNPTQAKSNSGVAAFTS